MRTHRFLASALLALGLAGCASTPSAPQVVFARVAVASITPFERIVRQPEQVCRQGYAQVEQGSTGGTLLGALIGGLLGHQVGHGRGNTAATIGGAVAGGFAGNALGSSSSLQPVNRCGTVLVDQPEMFFSVGYWWHGQARAVVMDHYPSATILVPENTP